MARAFAASALLSLFAWLEPAHAEEAEAAPPTAPEPEKKVDVTVEGDADGVVVEKRANTVEGWQTTLGIPVYTATQQWESACVAPCNVRLDPNSVYRVTGDGVAPSPSFTLPAGKSALKLRVHARSAFWQGAGIGLTTVGAVFLAVGGVSALYAKSITSTDAETAVRSVGLVILISGAVFIAVGLPLWLTGKSAVTTDDGQRLARPAPAGAFVF